MNNNNIKSAWKLNNKKCFFSRLARTNEEWKIFFLLLLWIFYLCFRFRSFVCPFHTHVLHQFYPILIGDSFSVSLSAVFIFFCVKMARTNRVVRFLLKIGVCHRHKLCSPLMRYKIDHFWSIGNSRLAKSYGFGRHSFSKTRKIEPLYRTNRECVWIRHTDTHAKMSVGLIWFSPRKN